MDAIPELARLAASTLHPGAAPPTGEQAVREFESYFAGALLRQTSRSGLSAGLLDGGSAGRMYREMFYEELAKAALRHSGLGLAGALGEALGGDPGGAEEER